MAKGKWIQGIFNPTNPQKYKGDVNNIVFRSSWEDYFANFLDKNPHVVEWSSEELQIPYFNPILNRPATYFPDFWVKYRDLNNNIQIEVIEIKPSKQVEKPTNRSRRETRETWCVNAAKWEAAIQFCAKHKMKFRVLTEKSLFK